MNAQTSQEMKRHYDLLGLQSGATCADVKRNARKLFLRYHPDLNPDSKPACEEKTKRIVEAYRAVLGVLESEPEGIGFDAAGASAEEAASVELEVLAFSVSHRALAVPTRLVREIVMVKDIRIEELKVVSEAFPFLTGVFTRDGEMVMLWDLHGQLRLRGIPISSVVGRTKVVVLELNGSMVGFLVDDISGISTVQRESIKECDPGFGIDASYVDGVFETENGIAGILNPGRMLSNLL